MVKNIKKNKTQGNVDFTLLLTVLMLVFIGIIMVFSSSWPEGMKSFNDSYFFVKRHLLFAAVGLVVMVFLMNVNYKFWQRLSAFGYAFSIFLVLLIFITKSKDIKGARRWLSLGPITIMPGDFIKITSIMLMSNILTYYHKTMASFNKGTKQALILIGFSAILIFIQGDLGTTITVFSTLMAMLIIGGMNLKYLFMISPIPIGALVILGYQASTNPDSKHAFRWKRVTTFIDPFAESLGSGWQIIQSLYALGTGGAFGVGLGKSKQKFFYLPESYNDFIFSILAEEVGFVGASMVIILYIILIYRGVKIAMEVDDVYASNLATGITALVAIQTLIHIAVVTSSLPTTGITLPFISYGGTSLLIYMAAMGILLNISKHKKQEMKK